MDGAGVAAEDEGGAREDVRELLEARAPDEVDGRYLGERFDAAHEAFVEATAADEDGDDLLAVEPIGEHGEVFRRPALVRPVRADGEDGEAARFVHALGREQRVRRSGFSGGDVDGEAHVLDAAAEGARDVEVALDDMPRGVCAPHGAAHIGGAFAHIHRAEAQLRARLRDDGSRLEEPLQIERRVVPARAKLMAEGAKLFEEAAHGAKALLLKEDDVVDVRIAREDVVGGRLDDPRQIRFWIRLLDRIGNGKCMDDVADGAELDDQDVFHSAPFLSIFLLSVDLLDDLRRGAAGHEIDEVHLAAVLLDDLRFWQRLARIVTALGVDGGTHLLDERFRRRLVEEDDVIDGSERSRNRCTIQLRVDGARLALEAAHGSVGIEPEHEAVAESARRLQVAHMPRVQDVEATVREDDALPRRAQGSAEVLDLFLRYQHVNPPQDFRRKAPVLSS